MKNVMSAGKTRQNLTKECRLGAINEHCEEDVNAVWPSAIVFQPPVKGSVTVNTNCRNGLCLLIEPFPIERITRIKIAQANAQIQTTKKFTKQETIDRLSR
jgi:hypothetical protein